MLPPASRVPPFDFIVFGGNGDLALRKLLPALYQRDRDEQLPPPCRIFGLARSPLATADYVKRVEAACRAAASDGEFDATVWSRFAARLEYLQVDASDPASYSVLRDALERPDRLLRAFYLATVPDLFGVICRHAHAAGLIAASDRVVLEKPLGHDLASSAAINDEVGGIFSEDRTFRIDHYLGKEAVQNLMALRFANRIFERLWNADEIDHVQITVAERLGVEGRGAYYEGAGALRDMVQNHMLQVLCLIAMEPPLKFDAQAVRDEKLKVLQALCPIGAEQVRKLTVRGQYAAGTVDGKAVPAYADEIGTRDGTDTETFVAIRAEVGNWRWAGVPFYLRTGKRMPTRVSEITVQFRDVPHLIFDQQAGASAANRLVIRLQPDEGIQLFAMTKIPGPGGMRLRRAPLNLSFAEEFRTRSPEAYERLLMDVVRGNPTLFMRRDEVEAAWRWIEPIMDGWRASGEPPRTYAAGTWGPSASATLIARDGRAWTEDAG
ncbi:MAG TPA: glucose-6-phosphate dehydrogenase [Candidatus Cybelea sp.]|nr:glucose-6-phosphate dehydrogenase [Candidatus Cybelea sp.]